MSQGGGPIISRLIAIQVIEIYEEKNKKTKEMEKKERVFGEAVVRLRDLVTLGKDSEIGYQLFEEGKKSILSRRGELLLRECSLRKFYTFLDLHVKNSLNIVPIVAVDYSLANLTFDENCYCLHTLKPGQ